MYIGHKGGRGQDGGPPVQQHNGRLARTTSDLCMYVHMHVRVHTCILATYVKAIACMDGWMDG